MVDPRLVKTAAFVFITKVFSVFVHSFSLHVFSSSFSQAEKKVVKISPLSTATEVRMTPVQKKVDFKIITSITRQNL